MFLWWEVGILWWRDVEFQIFLIQRVDSVRFLFFFEILTFIDQHDGFEKKTGHFLGSKPIDLWFYWPPLPAQVEMSKRQTHHYLLVPSLRRMGNDSCPYQIFRQALFTSQPCRWSQISGTHGLRGSQKRMCRLLSWLTNFITHWEGMPWKWKLWPVTSLLKLHSWEEEVETWSCLWCRLPYRLDNCCVSNVVQQYMIMLTFPLNICSYWANNIKTT